MSTTKLDGVLIFFALQGIVFLNLIISSSNFKWNSTIPHQNSGAQDMVSRNSHESFEQQMDTFGTPLRPMGPGTVVQVTLDKTVHTDPESLSTKP